MADICALRYPRYPRDTSAQPPHASAATPMTATTWEGRTWRTFTCSIPRAIWRRAAARAIAERAASVQASGRDLRLGLSGGRTPAEAYRILGRGLATPAVDWSRVIVLFADERDAPPSEPESNY